jgi:hypothetical protein
MLARIAISFLADGGVDFLKRRADALFERADG